MWRIVVAIACRARRVGFAHRIFQSLLFEKTRLEADFLKATAAEISPGRTVLAGPFSGMRYPEFTAAGSMLLPKILGTYESEIAHLFSQEYIRSFPVIVDIGCAEGYYAIGCARLNPRAAVYAYDTSALARDLCMKMALANAVESRVTIDGHCSAFHFAQWRDQRALVICDCEGCEEQLFRRESMHLFLNADLIVEIHEFAGASLSRLVTLFQSTHDVHVFFSQSDIDKGISAVRGRVPLHESVLQTAECRPVKMPWLWASRRCAIRPVSPGSRSR